MSKTLPQSIAELRDQLKAIEESQLDELKLKRPKFLGGGTPKTPVVGTRVTKGNTTWEWNGSKWKPVNPKTDKVMPGLQAPSKLTPQLTKQALKRKGSLLIDIVKKNPKLAGSLAILTGIYVGGKLLKPDGTGSGDTTVATEPGGTVNQSGKQDDSTNTTAGNTTGKEAPPKVPGADLSGEEYIKAIRAQRQAPQKK